MRYKLSMTWPLSIINVLFHEASILVWLCLAWPTAEPCHGFHIQRADGAFPVFIQDKSCWLERSLDQHAVEKDRDTAPCRYRGIAMPAFCWQGLEKLLQPCKRYTAHRGTHRTEAGRHMQTCRHGPRAHTAQHLCLCLAPNKANTATRTHPATAEGARAESNRGSQRSPERMAEALHSLRLTSPSPTPCGAAALGAPCSMGLAIVSEWADLISAGSCSPH